MTRRRVFAAAKTLLLAAILATTSFHQHVATFAAAADRAARFCTSSDIACAPGQNHAVQLARCWQPVVEWRFDRDLSNWQIKNHQQALKIEIADDAAVGRSLFVHRDDEEIDTAFELTSPSTCMLGSHARCRLAQQGLFPSENHCREMAA